MRNLVQFLIIFRTGRYREAHTFKSKQIQLIKRN